MNRPALCCFNDTSVLLLYCSCESVTRSVFARAVPAAFSLVLARLKNTLAALQSLLPTAAQWFWPSDMLNLEQSRTQRNPSLIDHDFLHFEIKVYPSGDEVH